ncbi:fungal zn(2)-Cys(6) binuclear cluster domain-containing protein [Apiospora saccharicola]
MEPSELSSPATLDLLDTGDQTAASSSYGSSMNNGNVVAAATTTTTTTTNNVVENVSSNSAFVLEDAAAALITLLVRKTSCQEAAAGAQRTHQEPAWMLQLQEKADQGNDEPGGCYLSGSLMLTAEQCQETQPSCGDCIKAGLNCEYPAVPQITHQPQHRIPLFSLQDMRFFQHFLLNCVPPHPLGNEAIWTHEMACFTST